MEPFSAKVLSSLTQGEEATYEAIRESVQYYANRISKSVNGSPMSDLPFILFALEQVYQGSRAASDPGAVKAADGLRELFSCISYDFSRW